MNLHRHALAIAVRRSLWLGLAALPLTAPAFAQSNEEDSQTLERVEVTGSRIKKASIEGQTPVNIITREDLYDCCC